MFLLDNGLLFRQLHELCDSSSPPIISRMSNEDLQFAHLLPDIITNFKPTFDAATLTNDAMATSLELFLTETQRIAFNQLKLLFDLVSNMNTIQEIKTEANNMKKQINLKALETHYNLSHCHDFYELRYVPLINQRIRNIINDSWSKAIKDTYSAMKSTIENDEFLQASKHSIWQESPADLPNSLALALGEDIKVKKLLMKSKGYDEQTIQIVSTFDNSLSAIIKEMNVLLEEPTSKLEDKLALVDFLKGTSQQHITDFITDVKKLHSEVFGRPALLFMIRFCCALVELCPHLKICFCQATSWRQLLGMSSSNVTSLEHWQRICGLLEDEVYQLWLHLVDGLLEEFDCNQHLAAVTTNNVILGDFAVSKLDFRLGKC